MGGILDRPANTLASSLLTAEENLSRTFLECCQNIVNMGLEATDLFGKQVTQAMMVAVTDFNANNNRMAQGLNATLENVANSFNENNSRIVQDALRRSELKADQVISMLNARGEEYAQIARNFQVFLELSSRQWRKTVKMLGVAVAFPLILISAAAFMPESDKQDLSLFLKFFLSTRTYSMIDLVIFIAYAFGMACFTKAFFYLTEAWEIMAHNQNLMSLKVQILERILVLEKMSAQETNDRMARDIQTLRESFETTRTEDRGQFETMLEDQTRRITNTVEENKVNLEQQIDTTAKKLTEGIHMNTNLSDMRYWLKTGGSKSASYYQQKEQAYTACSRIFNQN